VIDRGFISALAGGIFETTMRRIGFAVLITVVSLIAPFGVLAGEGTKGWSLLEPSVDETSNVLFGTLNQAPLTQWNRVATYDTEATCENKRSKAIQASREETLRLSETSPLPKLEIFKGAYRDSGLANSSVCVPADDPRLTSGSTR
jgi:hypothetical protein